MSLYNAIFGVNKTAPVVLHVLGLTTEAVGRFRDAWFEKLPNGTIRAAVYTRNGGGNREHYGLDANEEGAEPSPSCKCTGCTMSFALPAHPLYVEDGDDAFDSTYATIYFRLPDDVKAKLVELGAPEDFDLASIAQDVVDSSERWLGAIDSIRYDTKASP